MTLQDSVLQLLVYTGGRFSVGVTKNVTVSDRSRGLEPVVSGQRSLARRVQCLRVMPNTLSFAGLLDAREFPIARPPARLLRHATGEKSRQRITIAYAARHRRGNVITTLSAVRS